MIEAAVSEIDPHAVDSRLVADRQPGVVNREIDHLRAKRERKGEQERGGELCVARGSHDGGKRSVRKNE
jgi:hypothetical protein